MISLPKVATVQHPRSAAEKKTNLDNGRNSPCWTTGLETRGVVFHLFSVRNCIDKGGILFNVWIN